MADLTKRRRIHELGDKPQSAEKKELLLAMQLEQLNQEARNTGTLLQIPLNEIYPDPNQPRKSFKNIESLAESIRQKGVIQPIIVTPKKADVDAYYIIAGERRYRAAKVANLVTIPCIVRDENDANILILQLLENDQREKVSPFEEADALVELITHKNVSKSEVAKSLGHDASWISMRLKLAKSSYAIRKLAEEGLVEDVRTLYELKKLEEDLPQVANDFIQKIHGNKIKGSYRTAITKARESWESKSTRAKKDAQPIEIEALHYDPKTGQMSMVSNSHYRYHFVLNEATILQLKTLLGETSTS